jgi:hypothetical protein
MAEEVIEHTVYLTFAARVLLRVSDGDNVSADRLGEFDQNGDRASLGAAILRIGLNNCQTWLVLRNRPAALLMVTFSQSRRAGGTAECLIADAG